MRRMSGMALVAGPLSLVSGCSMLDTGFSILVTCYSSPVTLLRPMDFGGHAGHWSLVARCSILDAGCSILDENLKGLTIISSIENRISSISQSVTRHYLLVTCHSSRAYISSIRQRICDWPWETGSRRVSAALSSDDLQGRLTRLCRKHKNSRRHP